MKQVIVIIFMLMLLTSPSRAEYRVFRLQIKDTTNPNAQPKEVVTTLDPFQYVGYYPRKSTETVDYVDTWRCPDDTSHFLDYCPSPRSRIPAAEAETKDQAVPPQ